MKCCGVDGSGDYMSAGFTNVTNPRYGGLNVSVFCCQGYKRNERRYEKWWTNFESMNNYKSCVSKQLYNTPGCLNALKSILAAKLPIIIGVGIGIAFIQVKYVF